MDRKLISRRIGSILDDISRLSNALYAMDTTDIQRYPDNYEILSTDAALRAERIACRLRHLIYSSTSIQKGEYLQSASVAQGISIAYENGVLEVTLPGLLPKRRQRQSSEFLLDPLYFALEQYAKEQPLPHYRNCVVCFAQVYRLGVRAKNRLLDNWPERFAPYLTGDTDTNRLKSEIGRRLRLHRLAETYVTMDNAGVGLFQDEKPKVFAPQGYSDGAVEYPSFYSSREVKEMGVDTTQIRSSRFTGVLLTSSGIYVTYNSSAALMKWRYKSEMRVKALMWSVLCQQRLTGQYNADAVQGVVLGESMELAYQMLTSTGGAKHDYFMLDGSYDHFFFFTNDHQGEVLLALLCDCAKTAQLNDILKQGLTTGAASRAVEHDAFEADGTPVLFCYFFDLPRIARFNSALDLMDSSGTIICFDFQADVLRRYCGSRVRFQTIDFIKFERRFFP